MLEDQVEHPTHYNAGDIECIDAIEAQLSPEEFAGFLRGQIAKYIWRMPHKGTPVRDALKARFYLERLITHVTTWETVPK